MWKWPNFVKTPPQVWNFTLFFFEWELPLSCSIMDYHFKLNFYPVLSTPSLESLDNFLYLYQHVQYYTNQFLLKNNFMMIIRYDYPLRQIKQDWTKETPLLIFVRLYISLLKVSFKWIKSLQYCELWRVGHF